MMVDQHFCLRWNNYRTNITAEFEVLRDGEHFVDVTLACDGQQLKAHKVVLSACSPYFKVLLQDNPCSHPIIILRDVGYIHMRGLLEFMYAGEVNVSQAQLNAFLRTAEVLKVRGLAESSSSGDHSSSVQQAAAAAAAAAVSNSVADLLASSIGSLPLVPLLGSPMSQHLGSHKQHSDAKGPVHHVINTSSNSPINDNVKLTDIKSDHSEPIPLTVHPNNSPEDNKARSRDLPSNNKRRKFSHSDPNSPYYRGSNGSSCTTPADDTAPHDLSGQRAPLLTSLPPSLVPTTSAELAKYPLKTEPPENFGSDGEVSGLAGGWQDDSNTSDRETPTTHHTTSTRHSPPSSTPHTPLLLAPHLLHQQTSAANTVTSSAQHPQHPPLMLSQESHPTGREQQLPCPICNKAYSSQGNLRQHIENIHTSLNSSFACSRCDNKFKSKWYLHKHLHRAHHLRGRKEP